MDRKLDQFCCHMNYELYLEKKKKKKSKCPNLETKAQNWPEAAVPATTACM